MDLRGIDVETRDKKSHLEMKVTVGKSGNYCQLLSKSISALESCCFDGEKN